MHTLAFLAPDARPRTYQRDRVRTRQTRTPETLSMCVSVHVRMHVVERGSRAHTSLPLPDKCVCVCVCVCSMLIACSLHSTGRRLTILVGELLYRSIACVNRVGTRVEAASDGGCGEGESETDGRGEREGGEERGNGGEKGGEREGGRQGRTEGGRECHEGDMTTRGAETATDSVRHKKECDAHI